MTKLEELQALLQALPESEKGRLVALPEMVRAEADRSKDELPLTPGGCSDKRRAPQYRVATGGKR